MNRNTPIARKTPLRAKSPMRRKSRTRKTPATKSAREQDCTLRFPGCRNDTSTVVLCHLRMFGGGGVGLKPPDGEGAFGCGHCHDLLDGRVPWSLREFNIWEHIARAIVLTHRAMRAAGVLIFKGDQ